MDNIELLKLKEDMSAIKRKIAVLEWDKQHNQLNPGKEHLLSHYKKQYEEIESKILVPL